MEKKSSIILAICLILLAMVTFSTFTSLSQADSKDNETFTEDTSYKELKTLINDNEKKLSSLESENESLKEQLKQNTPIASTIVNGSEPVTTDNTDSQLLALKSQVSSLQGDVSLLEAQNKSLEATNTNLRTENAELKTSLDTKYSELKSLIDSNNNATKKTTITKEELVGVWHIDNTTFTFYSDNTAREVNGETETIYNYSINENWIILVSKTPATSTDTNTNTIVNNTTTSTMYFEYIDGSIYMASGKVLSK